MTLVSTQLGPLPAMTGIPPPVTDELSADFTDSLGATAGNHWSGFFAGGDGGDEAQVLLRRGDTYYAIVAQDCCFCSRGSQATVYTSNAPLGPWARRNDINTAPGVRVLLLPKVAATKGPFIHW